LIIDFIALRAYVGVGGYIWWHAVSCVPWLQPESKVDRSTKGRHKRIQDMHMQHNNMQHATCTMHFNFITKVISTNREFTDTSRRREELNATKRKFTFTLTE